MKHISYLMILAAALCLYGCKGGGAAEEHFLTEPGYRELVKQDFEARRPVLENRPEQLLSVFGRGDVLLREREALEFLYAYLPLHDIAEYDGEFFLRQVRGAFRARDYFDWGKDIPEEIFRHFVMVPRAANESLDDARDIFFGELKDRVKGMPMYDAALEVNHWCHEKITYRATDGRTMAPVALANTAWGRCGEESAFTVTAMRAVGIPARQASTPRWVHTDSNHAWVEVWVDGRWYFLGACEPEPELDIAWFTGPARRAMLVESTVVGRYNGPEEKVTETQWYSRINSLPVYADTRILNVNVIDKAGLPVEGATVRFKVYNYAELYSIYTALTDNLGCASLTTGNGDVMVWAYKDDNYAYVKSSPEENDVTVRLTRRAGEKYRENFVMSVPPEQIPAVVPSEKAAINVRRLVHEDSLRMAHMGTFAKPEDALAVAAANNLPEEDVWDLLRNAEGNWREIAGFISSYANDPFMLPVLKSLRPKDLQDTPAAYLEDHMKYNGLYGQIADKFYGSDIGFAASYIVSPRIALEKIEPWRSYFKTPMYVEPDGTVPGEVMQPSDIAESVGRKVTVADEQNYVNIRLTPQGVGELRFADSRSRDIYWVAAVRNTGMPARIEQSTGKPQYYLNGSWKDSSFGDETAAAVALKGKLTLLNNSRNSITPAYRTHFTVAKFEDGDFRTLDLAGSPEARNFPMTFHLDEGYYRLLTGSRANDGSVTVTAEYFGIAPHSPHISTITMPQPEGKLFVKGIIDMNTVVMLDNGTKTSLKPVSNNKGLILIFADPDREPTKHILQDIPAQTKALEDWGGGVLFMVPEDKLSGAFSPSQFAGLPSQTLWATDHERALLNEAIRVLKLDFSDNFPLAIYLSSNGGILYSSAGYRIGTGESLLKTIRQEQASYGK